MKTHIPLINKNDLKNPFRFERDEGQIFLSDSRVLMFSAGSFGLLRKSLIEELGEEPARRFLKRFGYSAGLADGGSLKKLFPNGSYEEQIANGAQLQTLHGFIKLKNKPGKNRIDPDNNQFYVEVYGKHSYEAKHHLEMFGKSKKPVCWIIAGYLSGYLTAITGKNILVMEPECCAMGDPRCYFVADFEENFSPELQMENRDYRAIDSPEVYEDLQKSLLRQQQSLLEKPQTFIQLQTQLYENREHDFPNIFGNSESLQKALLMAKLVAPVDSTVLLLGESGTGKELLAHGIHQQSQRADKPFIAVNCSVLPETLQEAELFGFKKGAFTGASADQIGLFESADSGTLFLDEIGDLTLTAQTKLLRTLQEGEIKRIGETHVRKVDVRIIASTNKDLERMVQEKTFRADLYYRLNVVLIKLPPLRERENDLLLLAENFVKKYAAKFSKKRITGLSHEAKRCILLYPWPGNVRELKHAIERAVILSPGPEINADELPERVAEVFYRGRSITSLTHQKNADYPLSVMDKLTNIEDESERLRMALNLVKGNREKAAALLGISRTTLWRRMQKLKEDQD